MPGINFKPCRDDLGSKMWLFSSLFVSQQMQEPKPLWLDGCATEVYCPIQALMCGEKKKQQQR
jgi:hypothetical protein